MPHALGDVADINIPAIAAASVVRRYVAKEDDELDLEVGCCLFFKQNILCWFDLGFTKSGFRKTMRKDVF